MDGISTISHFPKIQYLTLWRTEQAPDMSDRCVHWNAQQFRDFHIACAP